VSEVMNQMSDDEGNKIVLQPHSAFFSVELFDSFIRKLTEMRQFWTRFYQSPIYNHYKQIKYTVFWSYPFHDIDKCENPKLVLLPPKTLQLYSMIVEYSELWKKMVEIQQQCLTMINNIESLMTKLPVQTKNSLNSIHKELGNTFVDHIQTHCIHTQDIISHIIEQHQNDLVTEFINVSESQYNPLRMYHEFKTIAKDNELIPLKKRKYKNGKM